MISSIRGTTRLAAVIGWPVEHSRSPAILNAAFAHAGIDAVLVPLAVAPDDLVVALHGLRAMHALGASITLPHKLAAAAACDELTPEARAIGAVNCIHIAGARLVGHNTDAGGFVDGLLAAGCSPSGKHVVLLGAGGAARAVAHGLASAGAGAITVIARAPAMVAWSAAQAWTPSALRDALAHADLVVDCTSIGLHDREPHGIPLDALPPDAWVASLVYHRATALLLDARARGLATLDGRAMIVHQAARAFAIWTQQPAPVDVMTAAV